MKRILALLFTVLMLLPLFSLAETNEQPGIDPAARQAFIEDILKIAKEQFDKANGRAMPAASPSDIYVCKNFTVYMFRKVRDSYRMAEFPETSLVIPDNLPRADSKPYVYGAAWIDIPAADGNPFYAAATFRYDKDKTKAENREIAREFLKQVQRGDFFQMAANYYYGVGAHSLVFTEDYNPETDSLTWTDSNMKGKKVNGVRHGYIQWDAVKKIDWFVDAFSRKNYGATIYRLRDDIIFKQAQ